MRTTNRAAATLAKRADGICQASSLLGLTTQEGRRLARLSEAAALDEAELVAALADPLVDRSLEHGWALEGIRHLLAEIADVAGIDRDALGLQVHARGARNPSLLALSPQLAMEMQVRMLRALSPVEDISLWTAGTGTALACRIFAGDGEPTRRARLAARELLEGREQTDWSVATLPVMRWQLAEAALVFRPLRDTREGALAAAGETVAALTPILEREALLARNATRERALVASGERLLTRIGFDLHDGPIQNVAALAGDLRLFRRRIEEAAGLVSDEIVAGFLDDLEARIVALDRELRNAVHSLESPAVGCGPLEGALAREVEAFQQQSDTKVELTMHGSFDALSASQRIALVRIVQESLANARDHGGANSISISVVTGSEATTLEILDDGRGFDVSRTLVRAARRGRFGLLGMSERVRLLGGRFDVRSEKGGPTLVSVRLPAWQPAEGLPARSAIAEA